MLTSVRRLTALAFAITGLSLAGCVVTSGGTVYVHDSPRYARPVVVEQQPVYAPQPVVVAQQPPPPVVYEYAPRPQQVIIVQEPPPRPIYVVRQAPPPPIVEQIPRQPGRTYVWTSGYWAHDGNRWVWVNGRWQSPPRANAVYVPPRWERHNDEFHFSVGIWK